MSAAPGIALVCVCVEERAGGGRFGRVSRGLFLCCIECQPRRVGKVGDFSGGSTNGTGYSKILVIPVFPWEPCVPDLFLDRVSVPF